MNGLLLVSGFNKHVAGKNAVPGEFVDDSDGQAMLRVCTHITVLNIQFTAFKVCHHALKQRIKLSGFIRGIDFAPPDVAFCGLIQNDKLIFSRPASVLTRAHHQGAVF